MEKRSCFLGFHSKQAHYISNVKAAFLG